MKSRKSNVITDPRFRGASAHIRTRHRIRDYASRGDHPRFGLWVNKKRRKYLYGAYIVIVVHPSTQSSSSSLRSNSRKRPGRHARSPDTRSPWRRSEFGRCLTRRLKDLKREGIARGPAWWPYARNGRVECVCMCGEKTRLPRCVHVCVCHISRTHAENA